MIASSDIKTPEQYFASLEEPRRSDVRGLHDAIRKAAPKLKPEMIGGMLAFGKYHYKYESGREGDTGVVVLASQKNHISLYLGCSGGDGYLAEKNKDRLGKVSVGRNCIRFKRLADLDLKAAMELVKKSTKRHAETAKKGA